MNIGEMPGYTVQNGWGGRTDSFSGLPAELQRLARQHQPDLVEDPAGVLAGEA
jgi:hypothetical protein